MIKNDKELAEELENFYDYFRNMPGSPGEIMERWKKYPEGDKILKSLWRQEKEYEQLVHLRRRDIQTRGRSNLDPVAQTAGLDRGVG